MSVPLPRLADLDDKSFDPFVVEKLWTGTADDPYPLIHELRSKGAVHKGGYREMFTDMPDTLQPLNQYLVLGYDAVMDVLTDLDTFGNRDAFRHTIGRSFGRTIPVMDPPEHTHFRRIFQKAFLPQQVMKWGETVVGPVVDDLMGAFLHRGEADLVEEFTHHYPFQVIYRQLELDAEQAPTFHKLAIAQTLASIEVPQGLEAARKLGAFFQELLDMRRAEPGDDLVSHLAAVEADGEKLPDEVLISFLRQLVNAGGDTTYRATSALLTGLLLNPEQLEAVRQDRSLIPHAIDEALRWEGPALSTLRYVKHDTEINGYAIPQGAVLTVMLGSANRDPTKFKDPDRFDIFRDRTVRHLAFASGPHVCIGQHLARIEMSRALSAILDRLPNLRLDPDKPPPKLLGHKLRAPSHIYVKFDAERPC